MKKISIISSDTVPLKLTENAPKTITDNSREYSIIERCVMSTHLGNRAWKMAETLSKYKDFDVSLYIPDAYFPGEQYIDKTGIFFKIKTFGLKPSTWDWSEELDRKLMAEDFVIIQPSTGVGFLNCSVLPRNINVILDGFTPMFAEVPCLLLNYSSAYKKIYWNRFVEQYKQLILRANCILYANDSQFCYYEGQLLSFNKLDWRAYQFSPLLKVPYGIDFKQSKIEKEKSSASFKLLWIGPLYAWHYPEILIDKLANTPGISIDFVSIIHPRNKRNYYNHFNKFFDNVSQYKNITVFEEGLENLPELYKNYDAGIILAKDWLEERYSVRSTALDMISAGLPVLINKGNPLFKELDSIGIKDSLYPLSEDDIVGDINAIKNSLIVSDESFSSLNKHFNWDAVLYPLENYIKKFYYDETRRYWFVRDEN